MWKQLFWPCAKAGGAAPRGAEAVDASRHSKCSIHCTDDPPHAGQTFEEAFPEHGPVQAVVLGTVPTPAGRRHGVLELSTRPAAIAAANNKGVLIPPAADLAALAAGQAVQG